MTIDEQIQFEEAHLALHRGLRANGIYVWPDVEAQDAAIVAVLASLRRLAEIDRAVDPEEVEREAWNASMEVVSALCGEQEGE